MRTTKSAITLALMMSLCGCDVTEGDGNAGTATSSSNASSGVGGNGGVGGGGDGGSGGDGGGDGSGGDGGGDGSGGDGGSGGGGSGGVGDGGSGGVGGGGGGSGGEGGRASATLRGVVQKGPLVVGSSVVISAVDPLGNPAGRRFPTTTTTPLGDYAATIDYRGYTSLAANGFYFNEITGRLSAERITLRGLYDVDRGGEQQANVNVITHLTYSRVQRLLAGGIPLGQAIAQAEGELRAALGLGGPGFDPGAPGHALSLFGEDNDANAYLLASTALLLQANLSSGVTLADVEADLADDGSLAPERQATLAQAALIVNGDFFADRAEHGMAELGASVTTPDPNRILDNDGDGFPNGRDSCPFVANPDQLPVDDVVCSVKRHYAWAPVDEYLTHLVAGDITGDGAADVLAIGQVSHYLFAGLGAGKLAPAVPLSTRLRNPPSQLVDVDGDGYLDAILEDDLHLPSFSGWAPGDGTGEFGARVPFEAVCATCRIDYTALGDLDGDGNVDVLSYVDDTESRNDGIHVLMGIGGGAFDAPIVLPPPPDFFYDIRFLVADVIDGGAPDLLLVYSIVDPFILDNGYTYSFTVCEGNGDGTFGAPQPLIQLDLDLLGGASPVLGGFAAGDVDGDGHVDVTFSDNSAMYVLFGDGAGGFSEPVSPGGAHGVGTHRLADLTGDGKDDILGAYGALVVSRGRTFAPPRPLPLGPPQPYRYGHPTVIDLDGDGQLDVVSQLSSVGSGAGSRLGVETILIQPLAPSEARTAR
ncbi:FG-GAP repeat domain-containing protein [Sorangium cellulosum]|nr:VCBS repeat-containing protein [Sorangium cellulosum]